MFVPPRIADHYLGDQRLDQLVEPGRVSSFFKGDVDSATQAVDEGSNGVGPGLNDGLHQAASRAVVNCRHDCCHMHVQTYILVTGDGVLLLKGNLVFDYSKLPWEGRPFIMRM